MVDWPYKQGIIILQLYPVVVFLYQYFFFPFENDWFFENGRWKRFSKNSGPWIIILQMWSVNIYFYAFIPYWSSVICAIDSCILFLECRVGRRLWNNHDILFICCFSMKPVAIFIWLFKNNTEWNILLIPQYWYSWTWYNYLFSSKTESWHCNAKVSFA